MTEQDDAEQDGTAGTRGDPAALPDIAPERAPDDTDEGWGERRSGEDRDDDWYERERPPHW